MDVVDRIKAELASSPVVLFIHPWEVVDLRREKLPLDCRFRTGAVALECIADVLSGYRERDGRFVPMRDLGAMAA